MGNNMMLFCKKCGLYTKRPDGGECTHGQVSRRSFLFMMGAAIVAPVLIEKPKDGMQLFMNGDFVGNVQNVVFDNKAWPAGMHVKATKPVADGVVYSGTFLPSIGIDVTKYKEEIDELIRNGHAHVFRRTT